MLPANPSVPVAAKLAAACLSALILPATAFTEVLARLNAARRLSSASTEKLSSSDASISCLNGPAYFSTDGRTKGVPWGYHVGIMGVAWGHHEGTMGVSRGHHGVSWEYHGGTMMVPWGYHGGTMRVLWGYHGGTMGVTWGYHGVSWKYCGMTMGWS